MWRSDAPVSEYLVHPSWRFGARSTNAPEFPCRCHIETRRLSSYHLEIVLLQVQLLKEFDAFGTLIPHLPWNYAIGLKVLG